ncbi:MAG: DUF5615 family PIN-like protein [Saprospiraceae bacterium]|uniref:DUF5615 family PIN-like protein n=1 Tax=Candidatus Opimibacter skivensis TaxID=2982028 RepID=A0A9D7SRV5_9BACT|nr:DUF5615 family PIN-like protein [Candidatus Opimibacter skivensis]
MKLLFDQNISFRIINKIIDIFPEAISVRELQKENPHDFEIWKYAKTNEYSIVTFDSDFIDLSNLKGFPPKIIWLRIGNTSTKNIAERLRIEKENIANFIKSESAFLEIN